MNDELVDRVVRFLRDVQWPTEEETLAILYALATDPDLIRRAIRKTTEGMTKEEKKIALSAIRLQIALLR